VKPPEYPWSMDAYRFSAQALMSLLMKDEGFVSRPSPTELHWGEGRFAYRTVADTRTASLTH
jgi:hypothetical protein